MLVVQRGNTTHVSYLAWNLYDVIHVYMGYTRAGDLSKPRVRVEPATYQGHNTRLSTPICVQTLYFCQIRLPMGPFPGAHQKDTLCV